MTRAAVVDAPAAGKGDDGRRARAYAVGYQRGRLARLLLASGARRLRPSARRRQPQVPYCLSQVRLMQAR